METLGAHLLSVQGGEKSRATLQQIWKVLGQTLLDGKHDRKHKCMQKFRLEVVGLHLK